MMEGKIMAESIRVLIVEGAAKDAERAEAEIRKAFKVCEFRRVRTPEEYRAALGKFHSHIVVADQDSLRLDSLTVLKLAREHAPFIPVVIFGSSSNEEIVVECMRAGAANFVRKTHFRRLGKAVQEAAKDRQPRTEQPKAEGALNTLARKYEEVLKLAQMGHWEYDVSKGIFLLDDQYYRLHRTTAQEAGGYQMTAEEAAVRFIHPDDAHKIARGIRLGIEDVQPGSQYQTELRILSAGGEVRWASVWFRVEKDSQGRAVMFHGVTQDVTERKRSQEAVKLSEERFQALFDTMAQGVVYQNSDGSIVEANPAAERILGLSLDQMQGRTSYDPRWKSVAEDGSDLPGKDHPSMVALKTKREVRDFVMGVFNPSREQLLWLNVNAIPLYIPGESEPAQVYTTFEDVTDRKQAELSLRETNEKLRSLVEASPVAIIALDTEGTVTEWNPAAERTFGWSAAEAVGRKLPYVPAERMAEHDALRQRVVQGDLLEFEVIRTRKDGTPVNLRISTGPMRDAKGNVFGIMSINVDITERKQADLRLVERNRFIDMILENAPIGFAVNTIHDGKVVFVGSKFEDIYGVPRGSLNDVSGFFETVYRDPVFREQIRDRIVKDVSSGNPARMRWENIPLTTAAGQKKVVTAINIPIFDQDVMVSTVQDVTERWQAEEALRESEERFRQLAENINSVFFVVDITDGSSRVTYLSPAFEKIWKMNREAVYTNTPAWLEAVVPSDRERLRREIGGGKFLQRETNEHEFRIVQPDGSVRWINSTASLVRDEQGRVCRVVGIADDITERKLAEEKVRQSEEQFRLISENVADLIAVYALDGRRVYTSPSFTNIFGDSTARADSDPLHEIHPDDRAAVQEAMMESVKTGTSKRVDHRLIGKDGSIHYVESQGSTIHNEEGIPTAVVVVSRDVTEKKALEQQFFRAQRLESLGTLAGGVAHDLNNVLNPILLSIETLKQISSTPQALRILDILESSVNRGSSIVRQVLGFARGVKGERLSIALGTLVQEMASIVRETFPKAISVQTLIGENLWPIAGDSTLLHQLLMNLCVNARDAMPNGGVLTLSVQNTTIDEQYARMHLDLMPGPYVMLSVQDTGVGMPPGVIDRIFEPFFTTKEVGKGTGLGLSTVHTIVKSHRGVINVYSEVGKGTIFKVYLPSGENFDQQPPKIQPEPFPRGNGELILVVDDERSICQITEQTLETFGYRAITASDGAEALAAYTMHQKEIAAVITDMMMPVMDGASTIRVLRKLNPAVKVIASSGLLGNGRETLEGDIAADAFIAKPYTAEKLLNALHKVLAR